MATFGTVLGNNVVVSNPFYARLRIEWQLASQNTGGNFSTINWQAYVDFVGCDAQLDNGHVNWNGGALYNNGGRVYNYAGNFSNHTVTMGSGSFTIGHDSGGNATLSLNGSIVVFGAGTSSGAGSWALPTIPRFATITSFNQSVTDEALAFDWASSDNVSAISWWSTAYDGGGHHDSAASGAGPFSVTLHNLLSGHNYDVTVAVQRADSGLWTVSGTANLTTLFQNNFFGMRVP
jgi:hypothetical protein